MITIADIAKQVGVSRPTVSMVLNNTDTKVRISDKTRQRVLQAAEELGYTRNEVATSFKTGKTRVIGVVGYFESSYVLNILNGISEALGKNNYSIKLWPVRKIDEDLTNIIRSCVGNRVAGVIMVDPFSSRNINQLYEGLKPHDIPLVIADNIEGPCPCSSVISDDSTGIDAALEYLYELGHRRIVHISAAADYSRRRRKAFLAAAEKLKLDAAKVMELFIDSNQLTESHITILRHVLENYTAAVCTSDFIALRLLRVAALSGVRVPEDFSVTGFADLEFSALSSPPLTTVRQPFLEIGSSAAELLLKIIQHESLEKETIRLPVQLIKRESCGKVNPTK